MRDIRDDLKERLAKLRAERDQLEAQLRAKLDEIAQYEHNIAAILEMEEKRVGGGQTSLPLPSQSAADSERKGLHVQVPQDAMERAILDLLAGGASIEHPVIKGALEDRGFAQGREQFGRVLQGILMSMRSRNLIDLAERGTWKIVRKEEQSLRRRPLAS